jgi:succinate dehydrogenase / fumarate reductase flavoprotein subunit/fumarate reductase flavoprotein subunit
VLIDVSHLGAEEVERRFPGMVARTRLIGQDLARGPVDVSPTAHFQMGGVIVDVDCQTAVPGLLVAGEDAGGAHGANRLGGNGVAESTVFGARAGDRATLIARERDHRIPDPAQVARSIESARAPLGQEQGENPFAITAALKDAMWEDCGLARSREGLQRASARIAELRERADRIAAPGPPPANCAWQEALDVRNQVAVAGTMVAAALAREESRGAHFRADFPEQDDERWLCSVVVSQGTDGTPNLDLRPVEFSRLQPEVVAVAGARR